ncbi:hypothetical protein DES52_10332 [Deinococcus yavapaiensis KR-236]|uniref:Uncharacterized protein n=1 Tax=Deinococcus yavapaiensis KR-236 TaxID=694435 RepID=A0A318SEU3_9DEIO|nr:hypothetical protein DES52_10332 [Deinococcus yavapaiensis KR-236]
MSYVKVGRENGQDIEVYFLDHVRGPPTAPMHGFPLDEPLGSARKHPFAGRIPRDHGRPPRIRAVEQATGRS